ncbi:hypothetical protein CBL_12486 [Carabus blaptoides fortunei]
MKYWLPVLLCTGNTDFRLLNEPSLAVLVYLIVSRTGEHGAFGPVIYLKPLSPTLTICVGVYTSVLGRFRVERDCRLSRIDNAPRLRTFIVLSTLLELERCLIEMRPLLTKFEDLSRVFAKVTEKYFGWLVSGVYFIFRWENFPHKVWFIGKFLPGPTPHSRGVLVPLRNTLNILTSNKKKMPHCYDYTYIKYSSIS